MPSSASPKDSPWSLSSIFWSKQAYQHVSNEFHPFHKHDLNVACHLVTTGLGVWGALQLALVTLGGSDIDYSTLSYDDWTAAFSDTDKNAGLIAVAAYAALIGLTTPFFTALLHTAFVAGYLLLPVQALSVSAFSFHANLEPLHVCLLAIAAGYGLQDLSHYVFQEETYMQSYMGEGKIHMLLVHSIWLMPLVIDSILMRYCYLPNLVSRNRAFFVNVASRKAVEDLRTWINTHVPSTKETTHVWPHMQPGTDQAFTDLENDSSILAGFRKVFAAKHFDVKPVQAMNEIYVTAVGAKREINSDAVFYTPHTDGPYWFLPGASLYRVLVGVTPNQMVRTRFNLQHPSQDHVIDMYNVLGFDYSRELHWIDHVPGKTNQERRSLLKLHFVVYPKGWHWYGNLVAKLNTNYNTWARGNFLRTLRPKGVYEWALAWWIWLTTWFNAIQEEHVGWSNIVYIATAWALGPTPFLILTSFRHYMVYITTFAFRKPMVAHGYLMRDAKLYKTLSMLQLAKRVLPVVQLPDDAAAVALAMCGFGLTLLATARLGMVRTYFGTELGFVPPKWIEGFPYGTIPHPMIVGQLIGLGVVLAHFYQRLTTETVGLLVAHMSFYTVHMLQEICFSSY